MDIMVVFGVGVGMYEGGLVFERVEEVQEESW